MSYILDALKKIEHEKNKKAHPDERAVFTNDLFQERKQPVVKAGIWKTLVLIAVASLVTCAVTWFVLKGDGKKVAAVIRPSALTPAVPAHPPVEPPVSPVPAQSSPIPVPAMISAGPDGSPARKPRHSKKQIVSHPPVPTESSQNVQVPADIKLSGIAWQDDRSARQAVVNGFLLKEGAVVSGARITDIQADRVRFSSASGSFEIKLDAVLPAGGQ